MKISDGQKKYALRQERKHCMWRAVMLLPAALHAAWKMNRASSANQLSANKKSLCGVKKANS
jgi:hypothetical protein